MVCDGKEVCGSSPSSVSIVVGVVTVVVLLVLVVVLLVVGTAVKEMYNSPYMTFFYNTV